MTPSSDKLGLALAGGGFRASLFHVGVLRRLAELDVLRHVQVLSTVSGGSIVGAIYILRLKRWLEDPQKGPRLTRDDYIELVEEVDDILTRGVSKNLRTRLLANPLTTLRVMLTNESMGRAMARLYERHMLREAMHRQPGKPWDGSMSGAPDMQLGRLRIYPHGATFDRGIDAYNADEEATPGGSAITSIVLNTTSLNSGGRFFFSGVELGDWYLGQFRKDEIAELAEIRALLRKESQVLEDDVHVAAARAMNDPAAARAARRLSLALWAQRERAAPGAPIPEGWERLFSHSAARCLPGELARCAHGLLRQAKIPAWYLRFGYACTPQITGGRTQEELWQRVCSVLGEIDRELGANIAESGLTYMDPAAALLLEYIVELYLLRTAELVSPRFERDWQNLTISDAVGASACFPPVFPPFVLLGLYDDAHVARLGLTDGGVYDNAGTTALLDEGCTSVIASDTGGVFSEQPDAPTDHVRMSLRLPSILMRALGGFQLRGLRDRKRLSEQFNDLAYFQIATPPPPLPDDFAPPLPVEIDVRKVARLRTDLDCFGEIEIAALVNTGYNTADRFVRGFMKRYAHDWWKNAAPRAPKPRVRKEIAEPVLEAGASRFLRALHVDAPVSIAVVAVLAAAILIAAADSVTVAGVWSYVHGAIYALPSFTRWIPEVAIPLVYRWLSGRLGLAVLGAVLLVLVWRAAAGAPASARARAPRWLLTARKYATSYAWNVTWLAWALPLLVVAGTALVAALSWFAFFLPWRARAKIRPEDCMRTEESSLGRAATTALTLS